jgi:hypothetical protein
MDLHRLGLGDKAPINKRLDVCYHICGVSRTESWDLTQVAIINLIEASSFDDCNRDARIFSKAIGDSET